MEPGQCPGSFSYDALVGVSDLYVDSSVVVFPAPDAAMSAPSVATGFGVRSPAGTIHSPRNH